MAAPAMDAREATACVRIGFDVGGKRRRKIYCVLSAAQSIGQSNFRCISHATDAEHHGTAAQYDAIEQHHLPGAFAQDCSFAGAIGDVLQLSAFVDDKNA